MKQGTQGNAAVAIPGSAQEITRPGTKCSAEVDTVMFNQKLDLVVWDVFSSLSDFAILNPDSLEEIYRADENQKS